MPLLENYVIDTNIENLLYKNIVIKKNNIVEELNIKDNLFWIFYKLYNLNYEKYPNYEEESKLKFDLFKDFEKKKQEYKEHKLKKGDIHTDLIFNKNISLVGFCSLCINYNLSCIIEYKKMYYTIGTIENEIKYPSVNLSTNEIKMNTLEYYKSNYKVPNIFNSLESISKYKVSDLELIAKKNNIKISGKKLDIYEQIKKELLNLYNL